MDLFYICLVVSQTEKINNLAEICFDGLGVGGNYIRCLIISKRLGEAKRCGGDFKVIIFRGQRKSASHK